MKRAILALIVLLTLVASPRAAELLVPAQHATISAAITAASPGDTIRVTTAGPFNEGLAIDKRITLIADPAVSPVITGETADGVSTAVISIRDNADGAQVGSMGGGRFIIDRGNTTTGNAILLENTTGSTVLVENIKIQNTPGGSGVRLLAEGSATLRGIECIGTTAGFRADTALAHASTILVERSRFVEIASRSPVYLRYADADFTFRYCELNSISAAAPLVGREAISLYGGLNGTITFDHVWIRQDGIPTGGTWMTAETRTQDGSPGLPTINYRYCVFEHSSGSRALSIRNGTSSGVRMNIDHCDFVQSGTASIGAMTIGTGTDRAITVTNTNFINTNGPAATGVTTDPPYTFSHVNAVTSVTPAWTNITPTNEITPGVAPGYVNPATGNYRIANAALLTAGSDGLAIGANYDFSNVLGPPVLPVNALRTHWQIFE